MSGGIKTFSESVSGGSKLSSEPKGPGAKLKFGPDSGLEYERCSHSEYFFFKMIYYNLSLYQNMYLFINFNHKNNPKA